jgi:hypothetical protein
VHLHRGRGHRDGPYAVTDGEPLQCASNGSIDPSAFADRDGRLWLTWKDEAHAGQAASIVAAQLQPDGLSFATSPTVLLAATESWEPRAHAGGRCRLIAQPSGA